MNDVFDIIIPSIAFFIAFFMAFSLLEILLVIALNKAITHYWVFTTDVLIKAKVHHGGKIRIITLIFVAFLIFVLFKFTPMPTALTVGGMGVKVLAVETLLVMFLIYHIAARQLPEIHIERVVHFYLYMALSIAVFSATIISAGQGYEQYKDFINANLSVNIGNTEKRIEYEKRQALLKEFRYQLLRGECEKKNYAAEAEADPSEAIIKNFVYVTTDEELEKTSVSVEEDTDYYKYFKGDACTDGETTFLLTDHGQWYWVVDTDLKGKKLIN